MLKKITLKIATFILFIFCMNISIVFADNFDFQFDNVLNLVENNEKEKKVVKEKKKEDSTSDLVSFATPKEDVIMNTEAKEKLAEQKRLEKERKKEEKKRLAEQKRLEKQKLKEEKEKLAEQKKIEKQALKEEKEKLVEETKLEKQNKKEIKEQKIEESVEKEESISIKEQKKLEKQKLKEEKKKLSKEKAESPIKINDSDKIEVSKNHTNIVDMKTKKVLKFNKKYIYKDVSFKDNNYVPSGFMGDYGDIRVSMRCYVKPYNGMSCIKLSYSARDSQGNGWAGIYWQEPANNWGTENKGLNLSGAKKLVFYIKGEKGGEIIDKIKIGGIQGEFSDTADIDFGPIILGKKWQKYVIDLKGYDLSSIIGGFAFVATSESNPEGIVFYLDEMFFE